MVEKKLKEAINNELAVRIDRENNGMLSRDKTSFSDEAYLRRNNITIDQKYVYQKGEPLFEIQHNYAQKKVNGAYKELKPSLKEVEKKDLLKEHDAKFGDGLEETEKSKYVLHIKYKEPIVINGWRSETDTITFDNEESLHEFIDGKATYDYLDNSVRKKENEILLYAEKKDSLERVWESGLMPEEQEPVVNRKRIGR